MAGAFPGVHLVGSLPFESGDEAFAFVYDQLRPWVRRVPDETGDRAGWVSLQLPFFFSNPAFEMAPAPASSPVQMPIARLRADVDPADLTFGDFAYAEAAIASHALLVGARERGELRPDARLLVAMPAPHNPVGMFSHPDSQRDVLPAYMAAHRRNVETLVAAIPPEDLAIQWDLVNELGASVGAEAMWVFDREEVISEVRELARWVPAGVELGFHLCFGDTNRDNIRPGVPSPFTIEGHRPSDAEQLSGALSAIAEGVERRVDFVHLAIPIGFTQPEPFAPLRVARFPADAEVYLGVVHAQDGIDGARVRARLAADALEGRPFGIGTECGMGRYGTTEKFDAAVATLRELATELDCAVAHG